MITTGEVPPSEESNNLQTSVDFQKNKSGGDSSFKRDLKHLLLLIVFLVIVLPLPVGFYFYKSVAKPEKEFEPEVFVGETVQCLVDAVSIYSPDNTRQKQVMFIIRDGQYWKYNSSSGSWQLSNQYGDLTSYQPFKNGVCSGKSSGQCTIDALSIYPLDSSGRNYGMFVTRGSQYWWYTSSDGSESWQLHPDHNGKDLASYSVFKDGVCSGKSTGQCTIDTVSIYPMSQSLSDQGMFVTRGNQYWWYTFLNGGPWQLNPNHNGKDLTAYSVFQDGVCSGKSTGQCSLDGLSIYPTNQLATGYAMFVARSSQYWWYNFPVGGPWRVDPNHDGKNLVDYGPFQATNATCYDVQTTPTPTPSPSPTSTASSPSPTTSICTPDEKRCSSDTPQICSADGLSWEDSDTTTVCGTDKQCAEGQCVDSPTTTTAFSGKIKIEADFQGIPDDQKSFTLKLATKNISDWEKEIALDENGMISDIALSSSFLEGTAYDFILSGKKPFLSKIKTVTLTGTEVTVAFDTAGTGDLNGDDAVNSLDWSLMKNKFGQSASLEEGDLNLDGVINSLDWTLVKKYWLKTGDKLK